MFVEAVEEKGRCVDLGQVAVRVAGDQICKKSPTNLEGGRHRGKSSRPTTTSATQVRILIDIILELFHGCRLINTRLE